MKQNKLGALFLILFFAVPAAANELSWVRQFGTTEQDYAYNVSLDTAGNLYISGKTNAALPGQTNFGNYDAFVKKYDSSGTELWTVQFGDLGNDSASGAGIDSQGNIYVAGGTDGPIAGEGTSLGSQDAYLRKYNSSRAVQWTRQFGSACWDSSYGVAVDSSGFIYTLFTNGCAFQNTMVKKFNSSGFEVWTSTLDSQAQCYPSNIRIDSAGFIYVSGYTSSLIAGQSNLGADDAFVWIIDQNGGAVWTRQFGTESGDYGYDVAIDSAGNVYVIGATGGTFAGQSQYGGNDVFIKKFDNSGAGIWVKQFGTSSADYGYSIAMDSSGYVYTVGLFGDLLSGETNSSNDIFVMKFNSAGDQVWYNRVYCEANLYQGDYGKSIAAAAGGIYIAGFTEGGTLPGQSLVGSHDAFLMKYKIAGVSPAAVTDLSAVSSNTAWQVTLGWTSPGNDGPTGNITNGSYQVKYSTNQADGWNSTYSVLWTTNTTQGGIESKTITGLQAGVTFYFWLKTADQSANYSEISNTATGYGLIDETAPLGTPYMSIPSSTLYQTTTTLTFGWLNSGEFDYESGISGYYLEITKSGTGVISEGYVGLVFSTSVPLGVTGNSAYTARVKAVNGDGLMGSYCSSSWAIYVDSTPPVAGNVINTDSSYTEANTSLNKGGLWGYASGFSDSETSVNYYKYCIGTSPGSNNVIDWYITWSQWISTAGISLTPGLTYYISAAGRNSALLYSSTVTSQGVFILDGSPRQVTTLSDTKEQWRVNLGWIAPGYKGAPGNITSGRYDIRYSTNSLDRENSTNSFLVNKEIIPGAQESKVITGLTPGVTQYFWIKAADTNLLYWSELSNTVTTYALPYSETPPQTISTLTVTPAVWQMNLNWISPGEDGMTGEISNGKYQIKYSTNQIDAWNSSYSILWTTSTSPGISQSRLITGLQSNVTFYFWLKTQDEPGNWSSISTNISGYYAFADTSPPTGQVVPVNINQVNSYVTTTTLYCSWGLNNISDPQTGIGNFNIKIVKVGDGETVFEGDMGLSTFTFVNCGVTAQQYVLSVRAKNWDGFPGDYWSSSTVYVDTAPPAIAGPVYDGSDSYPTDNDYQTDRTELRANWSFAFGTDVGSGFNLYYYSIGTSPGLNNVVDSIPRGTENGTSSGLSLTIGVTYYFSVKALDNAGNYSEIYSDGVLIADGTPPTGTPSIPVDTGALGTGSLTFTWDIGTSTDSETAVNGYWLEVNTAPVSTSSHLYNADVGGVFTNEVTGGVNGKTYYARVKARNEHGTYTGLYSGWSDFSDGILVDTVPPTSVGTVRDGTGTDISFTSYTTVLSANWDAAADSSGIKKYWYGIGLTAGTTGVLTWTDNGTELFVTKTGLNLVCGLTYYFTVKAEDNAGGFGTEANSDGQVVIDTSPPTGIPGTPTDGGLYTSSTVLRFDWTVGAATDTESGIVSYWLQVTTATSDCLYTSINGDVGNVLISTVSIGGYTELPHYARVKVKNAFGLYGGWSDWSDGIMVDKTVPAYSGDIRDGLGNDASHWPSSTTLSANWDNFTDNESGILKYYIAIGSTSNGTQILNWADNGTSTCTTRTELILEYDRTYYVSVKAENNTGYISDVFTSNGIKIKNNPTGLPDRCYYSAFFTGLTYFGASWSSGTLADNDGIGGYWLQVATAPTDCGAYLKDYYLGNYSTWTVTGVENGKVYYCRVKGKSAVVDLYSAWSKWSEGVYIDQTAPTAPAAVRDGLGADISVTNSSFTLSANWDEAFDTETNIARYRYAIGVNPGGSDVVDWTEATLWQSKNPSGGPSSRGLYGYSYDLNEKKIVLFGGYNGSPFSDTWVYDIAGNQWTDKNPSGSPSGRRGIKMVYDPDNKKHILFGGYDGSMLSDTYVYDLTANSWENKNPGTAPDAREYYAMAFDKFNGKVILFGGYEGSTRFGDTWAYDLNTNTWQNMNPSASPSARYAHSMVYDNVNRQIIMFGGNEAGAIPLNDTWIYNFRTNTWTEKTITNKPTARYEHMMTYDLQNKRVIMFGGFLSPNYYNDTWYYNVAANNWYQFNVSSAPVSRYGGNMIYDIDSKQSFVFGGYKQGYLNDTIAFKPGNYVSHSGLSLAENTTYYYSVRYANGAGTEGVLSSNGQYYNSSYNPNPAPVISAISPAYGIEGATVTISGAYFGSSQGGSYVRFYNNITAAISSWSDTSITCIVPAGAESGNVTVATENGTSNGYGFSVIRYYTISGFVKNNSSDALVGVTVTLSGYSSGSVQTDSNGQYSFNVTTNNYVVTPSSTDWSFTPANRNYTTVTSTQTEQNFFGTYTGNNPPVLTWTGEAGYASDGLEPEAGASTTTFTYRVKYTDIDNDGPNAGYPKAHILKGGSEISGSPFTMSYVSGGYSTGAVYSYDKVNLSTGTDYTYYFDAQDSDGAPAVGVSTGVKTGPVVSPPPPAELIQTYTISGYVKDHSSNVLVGVTVALSGYGTGSVKTDTNGQYSFIVTTNNYVITLSSANWSFSPSNRNYTTVLSTQTEQNFFGTYISLAGLDTFTISGYVKSHSSAALLGVTVSLSGYLTDSKKTDITGYYEFLVTTNNYVVTPSSTDWSFSPANRNYTTVLSTQTDQNFFGTYTGNNPPALTWTGESGYVSDGLEPEAGASTTTFTYRVKYTDIDNDGPNAGYPKVHILKSGGEISGSPFTMSYISGSYSTGAVYTYDKVNLSTGTDYTYYFDAQDSDGAPAVGVSTGAKTGPVVSPPPPAEPVQTYTISGYVKDHSSNVLVGVTVSLSGYGTGSVKTDTNGQYSFIATTNNYVVTSSSVNWSFTPANRNYATVLSTQTEQNFFGIYTYIPPVPADTLTISGYVKDHSSSVLVGVTVALSGYGTGSVKTDTNGQYSFIVTTNNYVVTPSSVNWSFTPANRNYATVLSTQTEQNFFGTYTYIPTVPADTLTISGYVMNHSSNVLAGVTVSLSGYGSNYVMTDSSGQYSFSITTNNYVVTPSSANWSFSPVSRSYATVSSTQTEQNFFGTYIPPAVANSSPTLTWTGEAGYTGDGVSPDTGASTDTYTFRVKYADANGDAPASGYPKVHILKGGGEITNSPFVMSEVSGGYSSGMIYTFAKSGLVVGTDYTYYFEAQDSSGAVASGTPTTSRSGPAISAVTVVVSPAISVSPTSLDFGEITIGQSKSMTFAITDSNLSNSLSGTLSVDQSWISLSQLTASGNSTTITVTVNTGGMPKGTFSGTITITSNGGNSSVTVRVSPTCIITGPNPFRPGNGRKLIFRGNGVPNGTIWVYSLSGELLQELKETEGKYALEWDGVLSDGNLISSGVYFYTGTNPKEPTGNKGYFTVRK